MQLSILTREEREAVQIASEEELRRAEEQGRRLLEALERERESPRLEAPPGCRLNPEYETAQYECHGPTHGVFYCNRTEELPDVSEIRGLNAVRYDLVDGEFVRR